MQFVKRNLTFILCALPFVGVALWFLGGRNIGNVLALGPVLACPLSHIVFMRHHHEKNNHHDKV